MSKTRFTIAVVDDDVRVRESLGELLESAGYGVRVFNGSAELLNSDYLDIDCLVTDIGMPGMNGFDLHDAVRKVRPDMPVFLVTGRHDIDDLQSATIRDIAGFFHKPFDGQVLLGAVGRALKRQEEEG